MTLAAYGDYKYSGDKWLGDVPSHWQVLPLKHMADVDNSGAYGKDPEEGQNLLPVATTAQIDALGNFVTSKMSLRSFTNEELRRYACSSGDILVVKSSGSAENIISGKAGIVRADTPKFVFSNFLMRLRCNDNRCLSPYLYSLIVSHVTRERVKQMCSTTTYPNLQVPLYVGAELPCPPIAEQKKIVRFLDHETAKIDALIHEQERLIELLQEKRQAVISHAVTKGLDPNVPMKDSGVEWLGEVPAHWEVRKVSYDFTAVKGPRGAILTKEYCAANQGPYPVYSGQTDNAGVLGSIDDFDFSLGSNGGLLTTTVGAKAMSLNFVTKDISLSQNCMLIRPISKQIFIKFYFYHLQPLFRLERAMIPDHMQPSFRMDDLYKFFVAQPPLKEQEAIALALDVEMGRFDALEREARLLIERLKERRSALISAAVTGKIDVRNWQPPSDENALDGSVRETGMESTP